MGGSERFIFLALGGAFRWCLAGLGVIMVLKKTINKVLLCLMKKNLRTLVHASAL